MKTANRKKIVLLIALFTCFLLLSAFRFERQKALLSRMDLALLIENVLENTRVNAQIENLPRFNDVDDDQILSIYRTVSHNIMAGYPDGNFRPDELVRNPEAVSYLQKLLGFLRKSRPESYATRQLMRLFAYQNQPPPELADVGGFVSKGLVSNFVAALIESQTSQQYFLSGRVINAVTGEPLSGAYVAGEKKAVVTDENGDFRIDFANIANSEVFLLAAAEDFQPVELKKDLRLGLNITFRLRPEKKQSRKVLP